VSSEIEIRLKAVDEASKTIAEASSRIKGELADVQAASGRVQKSQEEVAKSSRQLVMGFSGVATSAFALYNAVDRVQDMQVSVHRANLQVTSSSNAVEDAQRRYNNAVEKYGVDSEEAIAAAADLEVAQERYQVAVERAEMMQGNLNEVIMSSALSVIPTAITMVDSLGKVWRNIPDVSGVFKNISGAISNVGISAKTAAVGIAAFLGGFMIADTILGAIPEDLRAIAGALTATIAAIVAATVAWMAFHGTMTVGTAVPIILAAVGVGIAGIKAAVGMAEGGIVRKPTLVLVAEAGPEAVVPLGRGEAFGESAQYITVYPTINIGNISTELDLPRVTYAVSTGIAEALRRRL